jgi:lycopene cyclase domain-containing protein
MKYLYLLLNLGTFIFPFALSFDKKVAFYKKWKYLTPAILFVAALFLVWDFLFTDIGIWSFNDEYITGIKFFGLPIEEILFFFTVPYACVFVYECIITYFPKDYLKKYAVAITITIMAGDAVLLFFNYDKLYTASTLAVLGAYMMQLLVITRAQWLGRFYLGYLVSIIPFLIVNGVLTAMPVVIYNNSENLNIRLGTIPVEDMLYMMLLLLMNIGIYERLQKRFVRTLNDEIPMPMDEPVQV